MCVYELHVVGKGFDYSRVMHACAVTPYDAKIVMEEYLTDLHRRGFGKMEIEGEPKLIAEGAVCQVI